MLHIIELERYTENVVSEQSNLQSILEVNDNFVRLKFVLNVSFYSS